MAKKEKQGKPENIQGRKGLRRENSPEVPGGNKAQQLKEIQPCK